MSCPYCTPMRDGETGESLEDCKEFVYIDNELNTLIRTFLWRDEDDGSWWRTVLMADEWKERKNASHLPVVTSFPAPPFCPHCGRVLRREPKWLWRLECNVPGHGLWYDGDGNWVWDLGRLDCTTKDIPMGFDWRYKRDGRDWFSSCSSKEDLLNWYSREDAEKLEDVGFVMARYLATEYVEYGIETTFIKETCLEREEVPIRGLWD